MTLGKIFIMTLAVIVGLSNCGLTIPVAILSACVGYVVHDAICFCSRFVEDDNF